MDSLPLDRLTRQTQQTPNLGKVRERGGHTAVDHEIQILELEQGCPEFQKEAAGFLGRRWGTSPW